ncbi:TPA: hypothetical protein DCW54_02680 [Candidatus Dependentiae bacterium]|nr:hypothetical protein [Candidatus Dependentiae bacterium]
MNRYPLIVLGIGILAVAVRYGQTKISTGDSAGKEFTTARITTFKQPSLLQAKGKTSIWNPDEQWDNLSLQQKAEFLQPLLANKENLSLQEKQDVSNKMHQFLVLLMADRAKLIIQNLANLAFPNQATQLGETANAIILFDQLLTQLLQPEFVQRLKRVSKVARCIRTKKLGTCSELCTSQRACIATLLQDGAVLFEPLIKASIGTSNVGNEKILGILPMLFKLAAPEAPATQELLALSIMLDSSIQLLKETGRILEPAHQKDLGERL